MDYFDEGKPSTTETLHGEVEEGSTEIGKLPKRLERYAAAKQRAQLNLTHLREKIQEAKDLKPSPEELKANGPGCLDPYINHLEKISSRLDVCGNYLNFRHYYTVDEVRLNAANFCKTHLLCPLCAIRRGSKMVGVYVERYETILANHFGIRMSMLTLTVKNGDDLAERYRHLRRSVQRLLKHRRKALEGKSNTEFAKVLGLVGTFEVTNCGNGWHPHAHLMILHYDRISASVLKDEWFKITGDSKVLRVDPARNPDNPGQDFLEVCKYALKFGDLTPEQNFHAYEVLKGKRLVMSAGLFWGVKIPEKLTDENLDDLPYFDMLYEYLAGSGYNLTPKGIKNG